MAEKTNIKEVKNKMRKILLCVVGIVTIGLMISSSVSAAVTVINFDDLIGQSTIPVGYSGLTWDTQWFYWDWSQSPYNPSSSPTRIATHNYGGWIDFNGDVDFHGAYFSGQSYVSCHFKGYKNNVLVGTSPSITMSSTPTFLSAGFTSNVDKVDVVCDSYNFFAVDDLTFERGGHPAPEFGSLAMVVAILLTTPAFAYLVVRRRK